MLDVHSWTFAGSLPWRTVVQIERCSIPNLGLLIRRLQDDSEHSLLVGSSEVRVNRLGLANYGSMTREGFCKGLEAPITIDVIDNERTVWLQDWPNSIQLEAHIPFTVRAIVNEKINVAELRKQLRKTQPTRTLDV
jgi:hypothetical protein